MVSSTEIPKAILNTRMVEGLIGMSKNPISPAVINKGSMFGMIEIKIILKDLNIQAMNNEIKTMASDNENTRLLIK